MTREANHFVTGRLAESALRRVVADVAGAIDFDYSIEVLPITVAALMNPKWIAKHIRLAPGTTKVIIPGYCHGGLEIIEEAGIDRIRDRNRTLTADLIDRLSDAGFRPHVAQDPARRSAVVLADHPDAASAVGNLAESGIIIDHRKDRVRLSPHFYNTIEDNRLAVEALAACRP